ncbi:MAG: prepilin-type N-terminal cleavage/methylation domain-containing protein [Clostridia bacterium]|nr:prepilin-type N-terminal cleavage/methylation domain-containing protein [Clostridia bacterium]MDD4680990.1 prepilin-type N-terminal cleavage/methylation domain-containing protein [Clostridia bacterium]
MRTSAHGRLGFTLVELILVLTLLSILSIIAVPRIMRFNDRWILQSSAHMLANDIRLMQRLAVQECSEYNFELHTTQFYYILRINDLKKPNMKKVYLDSKITSISSTLNKPYTDHMADLCVLIFSYLGSPYHAGEIILETASGESIRLTVDVTTGRVKVYD